MLWDKDDVDCLITFSSVSPFFQTVHVVIGQHGPTMVYVRSRAVKECKLETGSECVAHFPLVKIVRLLLWKSARHLVATVSVSIYNYIQLYGSVNLPQHNCFTISDIH